MRALNILFALVLSTTAAAAQDVAQMNRQIVVTGEGHASAVPDMALISLGVSQEAPTAKDAMNQVSDVMGPMLDRLVASGIDARDFQTTDLSLRPVYSNRSNNLEVPRIRGYAASNQVTVRLRDLPKLGAILDALLEDGANQFNGLQFTHQNPAPLLDAARRNAVADAKLRAETYADAAGLKLGPVLSISEQGTRSGGPELMAMASMRASDMPIAAGETEMVTRLQVIFAIAD